MRKLRCEFIYSYVFVHMKKLRSPPPRPQLVNEAASGVDPMTSIRVLVNTLFPYSQWNKSNLLGKKES